MSKLINENTGEVHEKLRYISRGVAKKIIKFLSQNDGAGIHDIARKKGISAGVVNTYVHEMKNAGFLRVERMPYNSKVYLNIDEFERLTTALNRFKKSKSLTLK